MSFLDLENKNFLVTGVANRKSVAWHIAKTLEEEGAKVIYSVRSEDRKKSLEKLLTGKIVCVCDVEKQEDIERLKTQVAQHSEVLHGTRPLHGFCQLFPGLETLS